MKSFLFLFFLNLGSPCLWGQVEIGGTVVDQVTNSPIPFASILADDGQHGTVSNEKGEFTLSVAGMPVELLLSHISYKTSKFRIDSIQTGFVVVMEQAPVFLPEVSVDGNAAYKMVEKTFDRALAEKTVFHYGRAFYRQTSFMNQTPTEILEGFFDTKFNNNGVEASKITEGRFAKREIKGSLNFLNFSIFAIGAGVYQERPKPILLPLSHEGLHAYDFEILNILMEGDQEIVEISCQPHVGLRKPAFEGKIFVDRNREQIMKLSGIVRLGSQGFDLTRDRKPIPYHDAILSLEVVFTNPSADRYQLSHIKADLQLLYNIGSEPYTAKITSLYTLFNYATALNDVHFKKIRIKTNDLKTIQSAPYNPEFWKDNPIVKRTPLEDDIVRSFESDGAFGNYIDH
ncbi:CarboxypepD_reg-like domain-containing protein [Chryseolinea serpens]|uniref:CarboxypepD_reg-like domain-containing protein n=1 Tax=Chryseolinea serpens TaxID=947013 RepID=A0A1M5S6C6_9BACT|nr:carboxypeptidase-like regulatory domain-containing protein [Chryseolinea serpens]SHH34039.1 CarboxypepD_reg-like domain-containing protein [Chryseolinea serpens]